ncbi:MAG: purine-nucleoside phosphorylase [Chloroflexota bacterium]|nr:purine-nucleoside phosphorylase [Chloroflexota bacterium]
MIEIPSREDFLEAAAVVQASSTLEPTIALVLGSGLSPLADEVEDAVSIDYRDIPHFPISTIPGHRGRLVIGTLENKPVLIMQGRAHYYEGYSMQEVTLPIRVFRLLGVDTLMLSNAAGGINQKFRTGDLMLIEDHLNLVGFGGATPLRGPHDPALGPRFLDMSATYDRDLRQMAVDVADREAIPLHKGVYAGLSGPTFETPADIRFLRLIGADAVGMSTVPEAIVARHGGMRVLGVSGISNVAIDQIDVEGEASHQEVLEAGQLLVPRLTSLIKGILRQL